MLEDMLCISPKNLVTGVAIGNYSVDSNHPSVNLVTGNLYEFYTWEISTTQANRTVELVVDGSDFQVVSVLNTDIKKTGVIIVKAYDASNNLLESKTVDAYPAGTETIFDSKIRKNISVVFDSPVSTATSITIEADDPTELANNAGYQFRAGEVFVGSLYQPPSGPDYGSGIQFQDLSTSNEAHSGTRFFNSRPMRKQLNLSFNSKDFDEVLYKLGIDIYTQLGATEPLLAFMNPNDPKALLVESVYGTVRADAFAYAAWQSGSTNLSIVEQL